MILLTFFLINQMILLTLCSFSNVQLPGATLVWRSSWMEPSYVSYGLIEDKYYLRFENIIGYEEQSRA